MAAKISDVKSYSPKSSDNLFFDNNIWMYLFCPLGNYNQKKQKIYSSFFKEVQTAGSTIFISSLVLSEFSNRYLRMDFDLWKDNTGNHSAEFKKDYIGTEAYSDTVDEIKTQINTIMNFCDKTPDNFNAVNMDTILSHLKSIDFNDSYYLELAKSTKSKIVTDDRDFSTYTNHDIEIITFQS